MSSVQKVPQDPDGQVPAVVYGAKSTEDVHGSVDTQLADCRAAVQREGRRLYGEPQRDEAASAYKGNRGLGLAEAKRLASEAAAAHGTAELWVQHSDRLARGDGLTADHLVEVYFAMKKAGVRLRSVQDDSNLDNVLMAAIIGERNHEDSRRKSAATRDGKRRQLERGHTRGPVAYGYRIAALLDDAGRPVMRRDGQVERRRELNPETAPVMARIFDLVEAGETFGDVARLLNGEGRLGPRGLPWERRRIREMVHSPVYAGWAGVLDGERVRGDHEPLIDPARWEAIIAALQRLDPAVVQARRGGRRPAEMYLLRHLAHCARCNAPMYTKRLAAGRVYQCKNVRQSSGLCNAPSIPAEHVEKAVLRHLDHFMPKVEAWIADLAAQRDGERLEHADAVTAHLHRLGDADRRVTVLQRKYETLLVEDDDASADLVLPMLRRATASRDSAEALLAQARVRLSEFEVTPSTVDDALDFFTEVSEAISGRIARATSAEALATALRDLLACVRLEQSSTHFARIEATVTLREPATGAGVPEPVRMLVHATRGTAAVVGGHEPPVTEQTDRSSLVYDQPVACWISA